jgi:gamma-glutamylcyclotransferase (GGCT)/AIG2-like uncharacterized protein YtfP
MCTHNLPIFVYGTLKPGESNYDTYLGGRTLAVRRALLPNAAMFTDGAYPYLVADSALLAPLDAVHGALAYVAPEYYVETLQRIDWLEDYKPFSPWSLYIRAEVSVETPDGNVEAWTYVAGPKVLQGIRAGRLIKVAGGFWSSARLDRTA